MKGCLKWVGICIGSFILLIVIVAVVNSPNPPPDRRYTETYEDLLELKATANTRLTYDTLARNPDGYLGQWVSYKGKVQQAVESGGQVQVLRVAVTPKGYGFYDDVLWVNCRCQERVLDGDIVQVWGPVRGLKSYQAVLGNSITIPEIDAPFVEVVQKRTAN